MLTQISPIKRKCNISITSLESHNFLLKMKHFTNFGNSTHSMEKMWSVEFSFVMASHYVQLSPLANKVYITFKQNHFNYALIFGKSKKKVVHNKMEY